jgi:hypothetical protein
MFKRSGQSDSDHFWSMLIPLLAALLHGWDRWGFGLFGQHGSGLGSCGGLRRPADAGSDGSGFITEAIERLLDCAEIHSRSKYEADPNRPNVCWEDQLVAIAIFNIFNVMQCHAIIFSATSHSLTMRRRLRIPHSGEGVRPQWLEAKLWRFQCLADCGVEMAWSNQALVIFITTFIVKTSASGQTFLTPTHPKVSQLRCYNS